MSKKIAEQDEEGTHPRRSYAFVGHNSELNRVSRALRSGRPPQAWLISGPPGIGKATLAYRIARYVLAFGPSDAGPEDLFVPPEDSVSKQIEAEAHPGLLILKRGFDERGKLKTALTVDVVRSLSGFFGMTSWSGGWRIAIVDSADDMNDNAANALLKLLEEPPARSLLLLVAHAPGRLLPTIRSRCQRLDLRPLSQPDMIEAMTNLLPDLAPGDRALLLDLAEGSPGLALKLSKGIGLELAKAAEDLVASSVKPEFSRLLALAERVTKADDGLSEFGSFLIHALSRRIRERAAHADANLGEWAIVLEQLDRIFARAGGIHMEPRQTVLGAAWAIDAGRRMAGTL
jgi:DNA polymerase-3 subunit delta'